MSVMCLATWYSSRIPLPPRISRASEQTSLAFLALYILASEAIGPVNAPCCCSCAMRKQMSCIVVVSASMLASLFWMSWKLAMGLPNCSLSLA